MIIRIISQFQEKIKVNNCKKGKGDNMGRIVGKQSIAFDEPAYIIEGASIVGEKEGEGPLGKQFDVVEQDPMLGQDSWEEAESLLQKEAIQFVSAKAQAEFMKEAICNQWVNDEEIRIYKRGRNAKNTRTMKNTSVIVHNQSSGFEALIGHLYLLQNDERIAEIFELYKEFVMKNL